MLCFQGHGSREAKRKWIVENQSQFWLNLPNGSQAAIHITPTYVHLGSVVSWSSSPVPDIKRRLALAMEAVGGVRRHILANPGFHWKEKMHMFSSIVMKRFLHGAGLWVWHAKEHQQAYTAAYMSLIRKTCWPVLGHAPQAITDELLCTALGQFTPLVQRRLDILQQLCWISRQVCPFFNKLLLEGSWLGIAMEAWHSEPLPSVDLPKERVGFLCALQANAEGIKPALRKLRLLYRQKVFAKREAAVLDARFFGSGDQTGWVFGSLTRCKRVVGSFVCDQCGLVCGSKSSLASHRSRRHGELALQVQVASGTECMVCGMQYWSTARLRMHLRKNASCLATYAGADLDFNEDECVVAEKGAWLPAMPSQTPQPWWATLKPPLIAEENDDVIILERSEFDPTVILNTLSSCLQDWAGLASACRKAISEMANFDGSIECAVGSLEVDHHLYNCFAAICAVAISLRSQSSSAGRSGEWQFAAVPPSFCLKFQQPDTPSHLPAELVSCVSLLGN